MRRRSGSATLREMLRPLILGLVLTAGLCSAVSAQAVTNFDGQYVGQLTLTRIISGDCATPPLGATYQLTIANGVVRFAYVPRFATTLTGTIDRRGAFKAVARAHAGVVQMIGRVDRGDITATVTSPSCAYSFQTLP